MSKDKILEVCQEIKELGETVTVRAVIDKIGGSTRDIAPIVKEFKERQEELDNGSAPASITVSQKTDVSTSSTKIQDNHVDDDPISANLERIDREAQLTAARKIISTNYYEKTRLFTLPGLKEEVNQTLEEIDSLASSQDETLSPKGMLSWLKAKQHQ